MKQGSEPRLRLCWLGHPRIELSGSHVRLEMRKTTALLAYLSLNEHPQSREKLAALFWPEFDQSRAPANLRRSLASLHASIPGDWLEAERDRISVRTDADLWIDVLSARRLAADVKAHPHDPGEPCPECLDLVVKAIRLFRGEFLEGFNLPDCPGFDDWQTAERESLRAELGWLLERSARGHAAAELWEDALQSVKRWLAQDKMHEQAQALLIRILSLSGQRSAAIRQYEEFAEALRGEFGQEPEKGTRELYNQILSRQIGPREKTKDTPRGGPEESDAQLTGSKEPRAVQPPAQGADLFPGLLGTKLSVPPVREGVVRRRRLIRLLAQGLTRGLVVVSAPAGFGKTTILSELAAQAKMPMAWLSLDEGDNDLQRFLLHLAASIMRTGEGIGEEAGQMLQAMPPAPAEMVMTALINAIQEHGTGIALVLDDYQFIQTLEVHAAVRFLIDHRPASLVIFVATREDPPFPLARMRSQDRVAEIRAENLRFTGAEAEQFFDRAMSLSLSAAQVAILAHVQHSAC
jgi:DNA-binding SARP family transcriptional activator